MTDEVKKIYRLYRTKSELSEDEVKKIFNMSVNPTNVVELQTIVKTVKDVDIKKQAQNYLSGMAVKSRITRLEDLKEKSYPEGYQNKFQMCNLVGLLIIILM